MADSTGKTLSRLEILRARQNKLRQSYQTQIAASRVSISTFSNEEDIAEEEEPAKPTASSTLTPSPTESSTTITTATVTTKTKTTSLLQQENETLKRQVVALQSDKELLIAKQQERIESACHQLNEMEEILEEYQNHAEDCEQETILLKAQLTLLKEQENAAQETIQKQQSRLDSACGQMNDLEEQLGKSLNDLELSECRVKVLETQLQQQLCINQHYQQQQQQPQTQQPPLPLQQPQQHVYLPSSSPSIPRFPHTTLNPYSSPYNPPNSPNEGGGSVRSSNGSVGSNNQHHHSSKPRKQNGNTGKKQRNRR